ncbi:MAG: hypothetical protein IJX15_05145 [Ruminiclostridium sp.]|nr:hypothetical protein [Ruminiclostridium sp.]MBQ8411099.1 hypothetical protein [Ruminiclostridium sp.]MBQ8842757.1 hypothetical protein [Ruminiclostridium sp.]
MQEDNFKLYIVVSQTGTILSRILKKITGAPYNHVSVSLDKNLHQMYSFGRINPYNPVWGGFVTESPDKGTFKRFHKTDAVILTHDISKEQHENIKRHLTGMWCNRKKYGYNYIGLFLAAIKLRYKHRNRFYCSEFARDVLLRFKVADSDQFPKITKPMDFLKLEDSHVIYKGKLKEYPKK